MTSATASPKPTGNESATIYAALEMSKKSWVVAVQTPASSKLSRYTVKGGDSEELVRLLCCIREQARSEVDGPIEVVTCYEAGRDGYWLHRVLCANGIANQVMDAASLPVNQKQKRAKTDKIDVKTILRTLKAWHRGDPQACSMVQVPTPEQEDERRTMREYGRLKTEKSEHLSRIHSLTNLHGVWSFKPLRRDWRDQLESLWTADGRPFPPRLKGEIARECERLHQVQEMIKTIVREDWARRRTAKETARDKQPAQKTALEERAELIDYLTMLRGIGEITASFLVGEVFYKRFYNRKEVAGYVGLTPQPYKSGNMDADQGLDKAGNPRARWILIELAWNWLFYQPDSALSRWFRERVGDARGRQRRIKITAMARKLLVALWRYVTQGVVPEDAVVTS